MTSATPPYQGRTRARHSRRFDAAGLVLGIALSGFFDGILLHQVLQWHHLLSLVGGPSLRDLRNQVLADGMFHVAIYLVMVVGLWLLWGRREEFAAPRSGRALWGDVLLGFGLWNIIDVVGFHWIAGIHRIRVDVPDPLAWDLGWLVIFGAVPLLIGWCVRFASGRNSGLGGGAAAATLTLLLLVGGAWAMRPSPAGAMAGVVFGPHLSQAEALAAVAKVDGRVVSIDPTGTTMVLALPSQAARWRLYREGALVVGGTGLAGCAAFVKT